MKITEVLNISLQSIKGNKLRTMLTVLGVVVGNIFHNCYYDNYYYAPG